ncbi:hypothetical protein KVR01_013113 [Diaporthe batatas]|uniref:uncharacterized protein n=1 Tax=Diaporthe batatas TaxID=748121 RepID=UPI001D038FC4|nr:uncharacterized protein KVR01_013113 [Diaporthe batatas]KAG8157123.1 hypothetical protein KVR01_013113 [Diaporthe batatas]
MAQITDLPVELMLQIFGCWGHSVQELSALSRCSRLLHWMAFDHLFTKAFQWRCTNHGNQPRIVFMRLVAHAIKCDSQHIAQWLCYQELHVSEQLNGILPPGWRFSETVTYLHLAILGDAPRVANHLVRYGTDVWEGGGDYPDITPLYLAIANPRGARKGLDAALRIACSYALPRTCRYLLTRGADPNTPSRFGLAAIHLAVRRRLPWRNFDALRGLVHGDASSSSPASGWDASLTQTADVLLRFGADPSLRSDTPRAHPCGPGCWRSPDCEHRGQAVLHHACGGAPREVIALLLSHGADPRAPDGDGYLPLFAALCHDHGGVAMLLLEDDACADPANPVVVQPHQSTALHIACRFACEEAVAFLLDRGGADVNATDARGQTPLHELLGQVCPGMEGRVVGVLPLLDAHGAVADIRDHGGATARQVARAHPFLLVRQFFDPPVVDTRAYAHFEEPQNCTWEPAATAVSPRRSHRPSRRHRGTRVRPEARGANSSSCESFPLLDLDGPPPPARDGVARVAPTPGSVWLDWETTDRLMVPAPPPPPPPSYPPARHQRRTNRREPGPRKAAVAAGLDDGGKPSSRAPAVSGEEETSRKVSESAKFWGTLASSRQEKPSRQKAEAARGEEGWKENNRGGVAGRRKRGDKWAPLDVSESWW